MFLVLHTFSDFIQTIDKKLNPSIVRTIVGATRTIGKNLMKTNSNNNKVNIEQKPAKIVDNALNASKTFAMYRYTMEMVAFLCPRILRRVMGFTPKTFVRGLLKKDAFPTSEGVIPAVEKTEFLNNEKMEKHESSSPKTVKRFVIVKSKKQDKED